MEKFDNRFERIRSINNIVITSTEFMAAFTGIQDCVQRSISFSEPVGSMLLAEGGLGKTTLCKAILSLMPRSEKTEKDHKKFIIPVCYVEVPSPATVKSLAIMMLKELGDLTCENGYGTTEYLTSRLIHLLAQCETKLIFLDEFHHLFERKPTSTRMNRTTGNWIKTLVNRTGISFCLVGLPEFVPLLQIDSQIARRFPFIYHLSPLTVDPSQGSSMFAFLAEVSRTLNKQNITFMPALDSQLVGMQIQLATKGYHSYIMSLIRESITHALNDGRQVVNSNDFSYAWKLGITLYISKQSKNPFEMNISQIISLMK